MALGYIADSMVTSWLATLQTQARYASVHFEVPSWTDPGASEVFAAGYSRQLLYWTSDGARGLITANPLVFPAIPAMTVPAIGLWDSLVNGAMKAYCTAPPGLAAYLATTGQLTIPAGDLAVRL